MAHCADIDLEDRLRVRGKGGKERAVPGPPLLLSRSAPGHRADLREEMGEGQGRHGRDGVQAIASRMPTSSALVEQINRAFERFLPRLELRCIVLEDQIHASLCEFGPEGEFLGRADQPQDFSALLHQPPTRAEHFVEGCALALEAQVRDFESTGARDWLFKLGAPHELFPQVLLKAEALQTAEAFAAAIGDPWGLRAELETDELLEQHPEFQFLAKDALGRELVDALFGLFNNRFSKGRAMKLLRRVSTENRSELAPVLVAFIDHTARAPDFRINLHPVATDSAFQILQRWGAVPEGAEGRWLDEGVISPPVVGA